MLIVAWNYVISKWQCLGSILFTGAPRTPALGPQYEEEKSMYSLFIYQFIHLSSASKRKEGENE